MKFVPMTVPAVVVAAAAADAATHDDDRIRKFMHCSNYVVMSYSNNIIIIINTFQMLSSLQ